MYRPVSRVARLSRQAFVLLFLTFTFFIQIGSPVAIASLSNPRKSFSARDEAFLEDLERRSFQYFWEQAGAGTGLVLDRTRTDGAPADEDHRTVASIAATGFGLTALCIAAERGWVTREAARDRVRTTVRFFADRALQEHGWFYHWLDVNTGERKWKSEVSSIDTALLVAGALTARHYFHDDAEIVRSATAIYERIDFPWMLNWNYYAGYKYLGKTPLFTYQYPHAWVDFRERRETKGEHIDYFENSVKASLADRQFCIDLSKEFPGYGPNLWGISASDSAKGYVAWGGPPRDPAIDGTVVPYAAAGSLMFIPHLSVAALKTMREKYGKDIYGRYGFADAFNPNNGWIDGDVIGIDLGITLLAAENTRSGSVWRWFMKNSEIPR